MMSTTKPKPQVVSLDTTWPVMQECLDLYMAGRHAEVPPAKYMEAYTAVFNYCTASRIYRKPDPLKDGNVPGLLLIGRDLYDEIKGYFAAHLDTLRKKFTLLSGPDLLSVYNSEWDRYRIGAEHANRCFNYFNRFWVDRERSEGKISFHRIYDLALLQWRDKIFYSIQNQDHQLIATLLKIINNGRNGEHVDIELVKNVLNSLVAMSLNETSEAKTSLELYREEFEVPFLEATRKYLNEKYGELLADPKIQGTAQNQLPETESQISLCLHPSTNQKVLEAWHSVIACDQGGSV